MFGDRVMKQVITVQRGQTCGPSSSMTVSFSEKLGTKTHTGGDHVRTGRGGGGPPAEEGGRRGNRPRRPRARRLPASRAARTPISVFQGSQSGVLSCGTPAKVRPEKVGELGTEGQEMRGRHV